MYVQRSILYATVSAAALFAASTAQATVQTYSATGTCSEACGASATVTTGSGSLTVVLTNTQANPRSLGDLLSNFEITLGGSASLTSQAGNLINIDGSGNVTTASGNPTHWTAGSSGGVITLSTFSGSTPINMIIGPPGAGGIYNNMGSDGIVNGNFDPFINGTGTFIVADSLITGTTPLPGSVTFSFGTALNEFTLPGLPGSPPPVPLPPAALLFGTALIGMGILGRRRRGVAQA
jgi:hypothetical protein